jgi:peptidoglycan/LPS O-acetylase OafA/YrhL
MLTLRRVGWLVAAAVGLTLAYRLGMFHYAADRSIGQKVLLLEQLPGRLDQFVIGTAAAVWIANQPELGRALPAARARALLLIGLALLFGLFLQMHWKSMQYWEGHWLLFSFHGLASIGIAACMIAACSERIADLRLLATRPLVFLGSVSYSLYLWHQLIIQWLGKQPWVEQASPYTLPVLLLAGGGPALLVAWVSWRLIEQPCLAWGRSALPVGAGQGGGHARRGTDR